MEGAEGRGERAGGELGQRWMGSSVGQQWRAVTAVRQWAVGGHAVKPYLARRLPLPLCGPPVLPPRLHNPLPLATTTTPATPPPPQLKFTRREWDMNRPDAKAIDLPARVGDGDGRAGPSSLQQFDGEDLTVSGLTGQEGRGAAGGVVAVAVGCVCKQGWDGGVRRQPGRVAGQVAGGRV